MLKVASFWSRLQQKIARVLAGSSKADWADLLAVVCSISLDCAALPAACCLLPVTGDLAVPILRSLSPRWRDFKNAGPGFTLPVNIGDLGLAVHSLDLSGCNLIGTRIHPSTTYLLLCMSFRIHSFSDWLRAAYHIE